MHVYVHIKDKKNEIPLTTTLQKILTHLTCFQVNDTNTRFSRPFNLNPDSFPLLVIYNLASVEPGLHLQHCSGLLHYPL